MKKEELKAAIKANFESNEFDVAMGLNDSLMQEYAEVAGKRSLASLVSYYRKKAGATEAVEAEENLSPAEETTAVASEEEPDYEFNVGDREAEIDLEKVKEMLESENKALKRYCIIKEEYKLVSDFHTFIQTTMIVKPDGFGWENFKEVVERLGGKKGITERKDGSLWKSEYGLPVGEEITRWTIWKMDEALRKFAFRGNDNMSTLRKVTTFI